MEFTFFSSDSFEVELLLNNVTEDYEDRNISYDLSANEERSTLPALETQTIQNAPDFHAFPLLCRVRLVAGHDKTRLLSAA